MKTTEHAGAKLNLSLDVLRPDGKGYHDLCMIMQTVAFGDDLEIELTADGSFQIDPGRSYLPADGRNLAMKAAMAFLEGTGTGARISVTKRIPVCAGMGGGSADAAAVLRALNRLTGETRSTAELCELGLTLGSDIPYCVRGGTALAEGRGEILTDLPPLPDCHIVICKPAFSLSTPVLFGRIDQRKNRLRPDTPGLRQALSEGDLGGIARRMYNVFEDVLTPRENTIGVIKGDLLAMDALGAVMTGTGSAVFGLFDDPKAAGRAYRLLSARYPECWLTRPEA